MKTKLFIQIAVSLALAVCSSCSRAPVQKVEAPPAPKIEKDKVSFTTNAPQLGYLMVEPVRERKSVALGLSGRLAWDDDVTARVFAPVSGRITEISVNPGQHVAIGALLAKIKSPDFGQAQADARKAKADLLMAERALTRTRELLEHGAAAQKDLEGAEADYTRALSENKRTAATLALYGGDVNANDIDGVFSLGSPVDGVVVEKSVNPGQEVRGDQVSDKPLFVVSDPSRLWLFLDVSDVDAATIRPGQEVTVHARALPDQTFSAKVEVIGEGLDAATRTIKARCAMDNSSKLLRAEMYVSADVDGADPGLDIPTKAVFSRDNDHFVFIETGPGQFQRRAVKVGTESGGRSVVSGGLSGHEKVVSDGCLLLQALLEGENS